MKVSNPHTHTHTHTLSQLPNKPGVYRFLDANKKIIYVGKARDLKKRVSQYFQKKDHDKKTAALVEKINDFEITITENENQALLLESNLIKAHHPKYNILLRDDKSYPYLFLSETKDLSSKPKELGTRADTLNDSRKNISSKPVEVGAKATTFPRLDYHRGPKKEKGHYFGPYPNAGSVRDNLALIQKLFQLRQCSDSFFSNRSRPCLQYQIQRCTAPCVDYVTKERYQEQVKDAMDFLAGKNKTVINNIEHRMTDAAEKKEYEQAAHWRDLLIRLRKLQAQQFVIGDKGNVDIFGIASKSGDVAVAVVSVRHGYLLGHKTFFPSVPMDSPQEDVLNAFITQYYFHSNHDADPVDYIVLGESISDKTWIENALSEQWKKKVSITTRKMAAIREWQSIAENNAIQSLKQHQSDKDQIQMKLEALQHALKLPNPITRIECFDISHTMGEATKASCVVFGEQGPIKKLYRQFSIENVTAGDDYAAMSQALTRRYMKMKTQNQRFPDLIIIDGGKGQLKIAETVLESLQISGVVLLGVAKGPTRKAGLERLFLSSADDDIPLPKDNPARYLIQQVRDEAHRFAITAHRKARGKNRLQSVLDTISGVGKKRKADLLKHFGGLSELKKASAEEIAGVKGISRAVAEHVYAVLHG